jgi:replicative DNA helicase
MFDFYEQSRFLFVDDHLKRKNMIRSTSKKPKTSANKDSLQYNPLPRHIEAEESLISAILIDNEVLSDVLEIITPDDFYSTPLRTMFSAISELNQRNIPVDLVTVANRLQEKGELKSIGGAAYLARIIDTAPVASNAEHYARLIHEKASLRRLIERSHEIIAFCVEEEGNIAGVFDFAERSIFDVTQRNIRSTCYPIHEILYDNLSALELRQKNRNQLSGIPTGFIALDQLTCGLQASDLIILAARPSMGKTALALNIARNAAVDANVPVAVFSLEMSKEQLSMRMLCAESRVNSSRLRDGMLDTDDWISLQYAAGILGDAPIYFDDSPDIRVLEIKAKARRLKKNKGLGLIIIDYLQLMEAQHKSERRDLEISEISRSLKGLAKELNIPVIALSQLNRRLESRENKKPQLSDLRESGSIEQDADLVMLIYRDEVYHAEPDNPNIGKAEIILSKHRNGPIGKVELAFINTYTRFENLTL